MNELQMLKITLAFVLIGFVLLGALSYKLLQEHKDKIDFKPADPNGYYVNSDCLVVPHDEDN